MPLTSLCLMLSCLRVSPDHAQFFRYDFISLSCEDPSNSTGWRVKRRTPEGGVSSCGYSWGSASSASTCTIEVAYPSDSGVYWCQSEDGKSAGVNITVTDRSVILESPARPVSEGAAVTLRCRAATDSPGDTFEFYKDGRPVISSSSGEMTIHGASRADEGLYTCSIAGGEESLGSWVAVEAPPVASGSSSVLRLMCHLVVGTPYLLSTILLGLIYRDRTRVAVRSSSNDIVMEIVA